MTVLPTVRAAVTAQPSPPAAIAFRQDDGALTDGLLGALVVLVTVLAFVAGALWFAKRRGWLKPWIVEHGPRGPGGRMAVIQRLRLSPRTTVFRVRDGDEEFVLVESTVHVVVQRD